MEQKMTVERNHNLIGAEWINPYVHHYAFGIYERCDYCPNG